MKADEQQTTSSTALPVMEQFYTLQGEGAHQGRAAYFIRLGGCDVECFWCDVKESWNAGAHPYIPIHQIVKEAASFPGRLAVITGGEPTLYDLTDLTAALKNAGFEINIETSGAHELTGSFDWVCLSPKKFKQPVPQVLKLANELKIVVYNKSDFQWAKKYAALVAADCKLFLQPEWDQSDKMVPLIVDFIKENPQWRLSMQVHKYIGVP